MVQVAFPRPSHHNPNQSPKQQGHPGPCQTQGKSLQTSRTRDPSHTGSPEDGDWAALDPTWVEGALLGWLQEEAELAQRWRGSWFDVFASALLRTLGITRLPGKEPI